MRAAAAPFYARRRPSSCAIAGASAADATLMPPAYARSMMFDIAARYAAPDGGASAPLPPHIYEFTVFLIFSLFSPLRDI